MVIQTVENRLLPVTQDISPAPIGRSADRPIMSLSELEALSGFRVLNVNVEKFNERVRQYNAEDIAQRIDPFWDKDSVYVRWGSISPLIRVGEGKPRYTTYAGQCFGGMTVAPDGEVKLFHFFLDGDDPRRLLRISDTVGGIVGSGESLGTWKARYYVESLGLRMIKNDGDGMVDAPFNILADPREKEIWWAHGFPNDGWPVLRQVYKDKQG